MDATLSASVSRRNLIEYASSSGSTAPPGPATALDTAAMIVLRPSTRCGFWSGAWTNCGLDGFDAPSADSRGASPPLRGSA